MTAPTDRAAPWPDGCPKRSSCARAKRCNYNCRHITRDIAGEVDAAEASILAETVYLTPAQQRSLHNALLDSVTILPDPEVEALRAEVARLTAERNALIAFKVYVHDRLDDAGIPTHPDGPHSAEGCRVGDRLDIALTAKAERDEAVRVAVLAEREQIAADYDAKSADALAQSSRWAAGSLERVTFAAEARQLAAEAAAIRARPTP